MSGFCGGCGGRLGAGGHEPCVARLQLEPPRFCTACGRRMVVQVTPAGWWAKCSRHGQIRAG
jgi:hypothetical protein